MVSVCADEPAAEEDGDRLVTELYLQNACPGGGLVLEGIEPPVTGSAVYLTAQ